MVTRPRHAFPLTGVLVGAALLSVSCEKVPLLAPTGSTITLTTATSALGFNGTADIIATVLEAAGTPPHSGTHIIFTTNLGSFEPGEAQTDVNGRATTRFRAGTSSGIATITASSGGATVAAANAVKIAVGSAAVSAVVASANPAVVSSRGGSSTITARVTDAGGNILGGIPVTFTTDFGSLSSTVSNTDAGGNATAVLTTTKTAKVTTTAGVTTTTTTPPTGTGSGTTTTTTPATSSVTVTANSTQAITIGTPSTGSTPPSVNQIVSWPLTYAAIGTTGASPVLRVTVNWGDGRTDNSLGQPPSMSHAYSSGGSYLIVVTGFDALDDTSTASTSITVVAPTRTPPKVTISASPSPQVGSPVTFTIVAEPQTGASILAIFVDYNDGTTDTLPGNAATVQHVYNAAGTYRVTATATDSNGATGSGSIVIVIADPGAAPTANFTVSPSSGTTSTTFLFDASASTGSGLTYDWDFGDAVTAKGLSQTHKYAVAGTYTVRLTVTDNKTPPRTATTTKAVTVADDAPPTASFTVSPSSGTISTTFFFDGSGSTGTGLSYAWDFGDAVTATGITASHKYTAAGTYTSRLTVTDSKGRVASTTKAVPVTDPPPTADFTVSPPTGPASTLFLFDGSLSTGSGLMYAWDFGDLGTATGINATHKYAAAGIYTVRLTVTDSKSRIATVTHNLTVTP